MCLVVQQGGTAAYVTDSSEPYLANVLVSELLAGDIGSSLTKSDPFF